MTKYCNSTDIHPRSLKDGQKIWQPRNPRALLHVVVTWAFVFYAVLLCTKSKSFPEANSNRKKKKKKVSIKYTLSRLYIWPGQMKIVICHENFGFVHLGVKYRCRNRQSLRGIIHGCFQVCKHLISCILQCARRDHLGHTVCCKLKHFKSEATLCRNRLQRGGRTCPQ